jgi:sulfide:quinone oxidoreductase
MAQVQVREVWPDRVIVADGRELAPQLSVITPPFRGQPTQSGLVAGQPRDWMETGKDLRSLHYPDIYVFGNATAFDGSNQGHTAMLQAEVATHNLSLDLLARPGERKQYDHEMICV